MRIVWLPEARRSRRSQIAYIAERNPRPALTVANAIRSAIDQLAENPRLSRTGRVPGTRELVVARTSFVVIYVVHADTVRSSACCTPRSAGPRRIDRSLRGPEDVGSENACRRNARLCPNRSSLNSPRMACCARAST
jgi:toxin ParE1/3/4